MKKREMPMLAKWLFWKIDQCANKFILGSWKFVQYEVLENGINPIQNRRYWTCSNSDFSIQNINDHRVHSQ